MIGFFQISLSRMFRCSCWKTSKSINPKSRGSVGRYSPKLSVYFSILIDNGVKNAIAKKVYSVKKIAKYTAIKPKGSKVK